MAGPERRLKRFRHPSAGPLTLVGTYVPDQAERAQAFATVDNILSITRKARFCFKWIDSSTSCASCVLPPKVSMSPGQH